PSPAPNRERSGRTWRSLAGCVCIFLSSRRRHTRFSRDWSSDVCSSDLAAVPARAPTRAHPWTEVEEVTVRAGDGERLAGWFAPAPGGAAVVLLPGAGSSRDAVVDHLAVLHEGGFAVLALDPRGHGRSTGRGMDWGWYGEADIAAAVTYLAGRADVDAGRIAVVGLSMGGEQAIGAAGADERIRAVVAEGGTGRQAQDLHWLSDVHGRRGAL